MNKCKLNLILSWRRLSKRKSMLEPNSEEKLYLKAMNQFKERICVQDFLKSWDIVKKNSLRSKKNLFATQ